jgi:hypothetical protein
MTDNNFFAFPDLQTGLICLHNIEKQSQGQRVSGIYTCFCIKSRNCYFAKPINDKQAFSNVLS